MLAREITTIIIIIIAIACFIGAAFFSERINTGEIVKCYDTYGNEIIGQVCYKYELNPTCVILLYLAALFAVMAAFVVFTLLLDQTSNLINGWD